MVILKNIKNHFKLDKKKKFKKKDLKKDKLGTLGNLDSDEVVLLCQKLIAWYNVKFPDNDLELVDGFATVVKYDFRVTNSEIMTTSNLNERLSDFEKESFRCNYIGENLTMNDYKKLSNLIDFNSQVFIYLYDKKKGFWKYNKLKEAILVADKNGKIIKLLGDNLLPEIIKNNYKKLNLKQLLEILEKEDNNINFESLKRCVKKRENDIIVRDKIIKNVVLNLVWNSSKYEYGYFRAQEFLQDFDHDYNLNIGKDYLDKLIAQDNNSKINSSKNNNVKCKSRVYKKSKTSLVD